LAVTVAEAVGFHMHEYMPERLAPPVGFVIPGSDYVTPGLTFGGYLVRYEVHMLSQGVNNESASAAVDDGIEEAIIAVVNAGWAVESVSEPFEVTLGGTSFLDVQMQVTREIAL
jgi:hypothetical protein